MDEKVPKTIGDLTPEELIQMGWKVDEAGMHKQVTKEMSFTFTNDAIIIRHIGLADGKLTKPVAWELAQVMKIISKFLKESAK
jgi:hypothetical protein